MADETVNEQLERSENEARWLRLERAVDQLNVEESVLIRLYYTEDKINNQDDENDHALRKLLSDNTPDIPYGFEQRMMRQIIQEKKRMSIRPCFMGYFGWGCS